MAHLSRMKNGKLRRINQNAIWCILHSDKVSSRTLNISHFRHRSQMLLHKKRAGDLKGRTTRSLALILKRIIKHEKFPKARGTTTSSNLLSLYHISMSLSSPCNKKEPLKALPLTVPHYGRVLRKASRMWWRQSRTLRLGIS